MFAKIRIFILLFLLLNVAFSAWLTRARTTDWDVPLNVVVYAINGDGSSAGQAYIDELKPETHDEAEAFFADIEDFFTREAERHHLPQRKPVDVIFGGELTASPPEPPRHGSMLSVMWWSLKLRYWAWRNADYPYTQDVRIFVLYFDPDQHPTVAHSLGLQKGMIGVVNAFAGKRMKRENHVIIAHELLHTVGATDKYDPATNLPLYPAGYADPYQEPLLPQAKAEIMAGRFAVTEGEAEQPRGLEQVVIGAVTAREINWQSAR